MYKIFKVSSNEITHGNNLMAGNTDIVSWTDDLSSLIDGRGMFSDCSNLETITSDLSSLIDGRGMFEYCTALKTFTSDLSSLEIVTDYEEAEIPFSFLLTGGGAPPEEMLENQEFMQLYFGFPEGVGIDDVIIDFGGVSGMMFNGCKNLRQFNSNLSKIEDGRGMFSGCYNLTSFDADLSSLKYGGGMFSGCYELTSVNTNLSSLEEGFVEMVSMKFKTLAGEEIQLGGIMGMELMQEMGNLRGGGMFQNCISLETFDTDLPALKNGNYMFSGCYNLTSFDADLSSLTIGAGMFQNCYGLTSFTSNLSSLTNGAGMFSGCYDLTLFDADLSSLVDWGMGSGGSVMMTGSGDGDIEEMISGVSQMINVDVPQGMFDFYPAIPANISINFGQLRNAQCLFMGYPEEIDFGTLNIDLSAVEGGQGMFCYSAIAGFTQDLPSLKYGGGANEMDFAILMMLISAEGGGAGDMEMINLIFEFAGINGLSIMPKFFCPSIGMNGTFEKCLNLQSFNGNLSSLEDGRQMFNGCVSLASFTSDLSSLTNGINMFNNCFGLSEFNVSNLNSLVIGGQFMMLCEDSDDMSFPMCGGMFSNCQELTSFDIGLHSLEQGDAMFIRCISLESFSSLMPNLKSAIQMFNGCTSLTSFDVDLSNLTNGISMFSGCTSLTSFESDLSSLSDGSSMFSGCTSLTSFDADLSSLITGVDMFSGCALNVESIENIVNYINDISAIDKNDASLWNGLTQYNRGTITISEASDVTIEQLTDYGLRLMNKGWRVIFNKVSFGIGLSITEDNYYIPDASGWNSNITTDSPLYSSIAAVIDNKFYDNTGSVLYDLNGEELTVDSDNIVTAKRMLENTYTLLSWDSPLSKLKDGNSMFSGCYNLTSFSSDLSSISDGRYMFNRCDSLEIFEANISSLEYGNYMFYNCEALTCSIDYDMSSLINADMMFYGCYELISVNSNFSSLTSGDGMFYYCTALTSFSGDLSSLSDGSYMFSRCSALTSFSGDLSSLNDSSYMFEYCTNLTSFTSDLSNLTIGQHMFKSCTNLTSFNANLSNLTNGTQMFYYCTQLNSFSSDLSSLTDGSYMFEYCTKLTSFFGNTSSLIDGTEMFSYTKLSSFTGDLSSLLTGEDMFYRCPLNPTSLTLIANTIKDISKLDRTKDEDWQGIPSSKRGILSICLDVSSFTTEEQMSKAEMVLDNFLTKGWGLKFGVVQDGTVVQDNMWVGEYDIKKGGFFIPDASRWNDLVGKEITLQTVINEVGTYGTSSTLEVDSSEIKIATNLMRGNTSFTTWDSPLTRLEEGGSMFYGCTALSSFNSNLKSLTYGYYMFYGCTSLSSFNSDLSSLTDGSYMFYKCKLNAASVKNILDTINGRGSSISSITIGIDVNSAVTNGKDTATQLTEFAQAMGFSTFDEVRTAFSDKGWSVTFQYGGTTTTIN